MDPSRSDAHPHNPICRPYVYSVKTHDLIGLRRAIHAALTHPIDSWIPDYMRFDFAAARMAEVVEADWRAKAEVILQDRVRTGQGEVSENDRARGWSVSGQFARRR
jgi:hypothetical protein